MSNMPKKTKPKGLGRPSRLHSPPNLHDKVGRPEFKVTPAILTRVERYGLLQLSHVHIAALLGISVDTEIQVRKRCPEFDEAIERGRATGIEQAASAILDSVKLNTENARFVLDRKGGWREMLALRHAGPGGGPIQDEINESGSAREKLQAKLNACQVRMDKT